MKDWFLSELRSAVAPSDAARFALDLSNQSVTLIERRARGERSHGVVPYRAPNFSDRIQEMRDIVAGRRNSAAHIDIILPKSLILHRIDTFRAEARGVLRQEAWWRLDSLTPFRPETLCYDVAQVGVDEITGFIDVSIAVAPRDVVDEAIGYAKSWGFTPHRITSAPIEGFPNGPLLLQAGEVRLEAESLGRSALWLTAALVLLTMFGVWRGVSARQAAALSLETARAEAEAQIQTVEQTRTATLELVERAMTPIESRRSARSALEWLDAIAEALPPGSVAERIIMDDGVVRLEGVTDKPEGVLSALEAAPAFDGARYAGPLTSVAGGGDRRRFVIEARLTRIEPGA